MARTARANIEDVQEPETELPVETTPRRARVTERHNVTKVYDQDEYEDTEPEQPEVELSPLEQFLAGLDKTQLEMHVYILPNYLKDGKQSNRAMDRAFLTSFAFGDEETQTYQKIIQTACPEGGFFDLELRRRGAIVRRWSEPIARQPGFQAPTQTTPFQASQPSVAVNVPPQPDPSQSLKVQLGMLKDLASVARDYFGAQVAPAPPATNGTAQSDKPMGERLVELALIKAVESDKVGPDKIIDLIGASRDPGWLESPVISEIARGAFAPGGAITVIADAFAQRIRAQTQAAWLEARAKAKEAGLDPGQAATGAAVQAGAGEGSTGPAQIPGGAEGAPGEPASSPPLTDEQKMELAYRKTASRIIDDCLDGSSIHSAAESIIDLISRYGPLRPFVDALLEMDQRRVFESFANMAPTQAVAQTVANMAKSQLNLDWIKQLQERAKELIQEWEAENQKEEAEGA